MFYLQEVTFFRNSFVSDTYFKKDRVLLNQKMSLVQFNRRTIALRREVDMIAGQTDLLDDNIPDSSNKIAIKESRTIIYNRIDKAGSTTLISKFCKFCSTRIEKCSL